MRELGRHHRNESWATAKKRFEYQDLLDVLHDVDVLVPNLSEARTIVARRKPEHSPESGAQIAELLHQIRP